jgi:hypothetical protein
MDFGMSREDIRNRIEQILSEILSDKHDMKITLKFKDPQESTDEKRRSDKVASGHSTNARKRTGRATRKDVKN